MMNGQNYNLNLYIQKDEIIKCIKKLKNNKAGGEDAIINVYIKTTSNQFIEIYEKLFNLIFDTGFIPESWVVGNIIPIYKNKGDSNDPKNVRPITLVSCLGKLFTAILSERLSKYSDDFFVMHGNQCGFRQGYCTVDNLFTLYSFFELLKRKKKKMYCAFIDFEKAFDKIWREGLWYKLLINNINGKMLNVIQIIYKDIKSNIIFNNSKSDYFPCDNGIRQGENLSLFLFAIFLNDLEDFLDNHNVTGLLTNSQDIKNIMNIYMNIFVLLYADDTVLMAETPEDLQTQLNIFHNYCLA